MSDTELLPKSKPEPVRRLEVFTGSGRRRMWTPAQKAEILAEIYDSGDTVSAVARRHGLTPQQLFGWRREAQRRASRAANERGLGTGRPSPLSLSRKPFRDRKRRSRRTASGGPSIIEIVIGAATVRVTPGTDAATLTAVLRAVKAAT